MSKIKTIMNQKNEKICVEVYMPQNAKSTIVFCHGITGCRKGRTPEDSYFQVLAGRLMNLGHKVVLFDFSGHGDSEGNDYDVCLSKSTDELSRVFKQEVLDEKNVSFLAFSYGATVLCNFLAQTPSVKPSRMVLYSPCLYPLKSCFLNPDSVFGKDIVKNFEDGSMKTTGYAVVGAKNFRFGLKMLEECKDFSPTLFQRYAGQILVLGGKQDVILNTKYNEDFCKESHIEFRYYNASHSLFEEIEQAFDASIEFLQQPYTCP